MILKSRETNNRNYHWSQIGAWKRWNQKSNCRSLANFKGLHAAIRVKYIYVNYFQLSRIISIRLHQLKYEFDDSYNPTELFAGWGKLILITLVENLSTKLLIIGTLFWLIN